jgi:hypothetical protein
VYVEQVPELIENQTGYHVFKYGTRWEVQDLSGKLPFVMLDPVKSGYELLDADQAAVRRITDRLAAGANTYELELQVISGDVGAGLRPDAIKVSGAFTLCRLTVVAGEPFEFHDGQTRYVQNFTVLQQTQALQSSQTARQSGLILKGKVRELPGRLEVRGYFELSKDEGTDLQTEKMIGLPPLVPVGIWLPVASLSSADASLQLKPFGVTASASTYWLRMRVSLLR